MNWSKALIPKELILEYAGRLSANALFIYLRLLDGQDLGYAAISRKEIKERTGIAENAQKKHLDELIKVGLIDVLDEHEVQMNFEFFGANPNDMFFSLNVTIRNCSGGFIEVPKRLLDIDTVEGVRLKPRHKILLILHLILSENQGYSFASREYLGKKLGASSLKTITTLNHDLERAGLIKVAAEFKVVENKPKRKNRYYMNLDKYHKGATKRFFEPFAV